jgi:hypothetical protein
MNFEISFKLATAFVTRTCTTKYVALTEVIVTAWPIRSVHPVHRRMLSGSAMGFAIVNCILTRIVA